ncbi:MAG: aldolase [Chloroflexi bacterium]|nr:aldolase [Chloroflexota bacterium]
MDDDILQQLTAMTRRLGEPDRDYVILGEGNTSAQADDDTFWVKASGAEMRTIDKRGFIRVRFQRVLAMLEQETMSDEEVSRALLDAKADANAPGRPSVETALHAACLRLEDVRFVGHTHPTAINMITCSVGFESAFAGRLFPDEIVVCGVAPLLVPYVDPGLPLAREVARRIDQYLEMYGESPRVILLQNHGLFALGATAQQVENITAMMVKTARILVGAHALGGPCFLTPQAAARIHTRPDEKYRQQRIG